MYVIPKDTAVYRKLRTPSPEDLTEPSDILGVRGLAPMTTRRCEVCARDLSGPEWDWLLGEVCSLKCAHKKYDTNPGIKLTEYEWRVHLARSGKPGSWK